VGLGGTGVVVGGAVRLGVALVTRWATAVSVRGGVAVGWAQAASASRMNMTPAAHCQPLRPCAVRCVATIA
jgi:hypothetical protein